ncbi:MAG: FAD-dependent oxidoreductase [Oscillospiraceae bacterium]|nr:FAD-dependent oxidoreductase [Oscillospiraceae bacterium]
MADERFDAIIVGGGLAGLCAGYVLAEAGKEVLIVERGNTCGSKNVTGGKLCTHSIEQIFPDFCDIAPVEREIIKEQVSDWVGTEVNSTRPAPEVEGLTPSKAYSVIRAKLDNWLSEQVEEMGGMMIQGILVDDLIVNEGKVCGVIAGGDELEADVVILAEGINALLAERLGLRSPPAAESTCVGVKEVIQLREDIINERLDLAAGEGLEWMFRGNREAGSYADGFLYTNQDTISLGIEFTISDIGLTEEGVGNMLERLKDVPEVAAIIDGGELVEYSAHMVHKGGAEVIGNLVGDGVLLVGDAAGLVANFGFVVRGMDLAIESGILAARAVIEAGESGDFSAAGLAGYQTAVENSFIASDMRLCAEYTASHKTGW